MFTAMRVNIVFMCLVHVCMSAGLCVQFILRGSGVDKREEAFFCAVWCLAVDKEASSHAAHWWKMVTFSAAELQSGISHYKALTSWCPSVAIGPPLLKQKSHFVLQGSVSLCVCVRVMGVSVDVIAM